MALHADLIDAVRSEAREAPGQAIGDHIRATVVEFCKRSRVWEDRQTIVLSAGQADYRLRILLEGRVDQVLSARLEWAGGGRALKKVPFIEAPSSGEPRAFSETPGFIHFDPTPDKDGLSARLHVVYVPTIGSRTFPDFVLDEWRDALVWGATARLLKQPDKPWSNVERGMYLDREYHLAIRDARQKSASSNWVPQSIPLRRWV